MNISHLNIGILHSLIGQNDGVSIVIDQSVEAMVKYMNIPLGNIFYLAAHCPPRSNCETNDIFWHQSPLHRRIVKYFCKTPPCRLDSEIMKNALIAKKLISNFVEKHGIDLLIVHNTAYSYNFITAVGLGLYLEERHAAGYTRPKVIVWWHDSYFERPGFANPNEIIKKYLKYLPGIDNDGIIFINPDQAEIARKYFTNYNKPKLENYFRKHTCVIPNTCDATWDWWNYPEKTIPPPDDYNRNFFVDIGLTKQLKKMNFSLDDTVILLQHTRVVPRKKIETAIDFAFRLSARFKNKKCVALVVSGKPTRAHLQYKKFLQRYFKEKSAKEPNIKIILIFGEKYILPDRRIIDGHKYYKFAEIPAIVAQYGGMGTYFSEIEGFGNNLLEMISCGLPSVINRYPVYEHHIKKYGFELPAIKNGRLTGKVVDQAYEILTNPLKRNTIVHHNLQILDSRLSHKVIAQKLKPLLKNIFFNK